MRIRLILAALALGLAPASVLAQRAPAEPIFTPEAIKAHVDFLADDLLEGRGAGTHGHEVAARYVATRFEALGLKPGGTGGSWYQRFPLATWSLASAEVSIGGAAFANREDVLIAASARGGSGLQSVTAG